MMNYDILIDALHQELKTHKMSMAQLATNLGISRSMVNQILLGTRRPGVGVLFRMYHHSEAMRQAVLFFFSNGVTEIVVDGTTETTPECEH